MLKNKLFCSMVVFAVAAIFATTFVACSSDDSPSPGVSDANVKAGDVIIWVALKDGASPVTAALTAPKYIIAGGDGTAPYPQVRGYWSKDYTHVKKADIKYAEAGVIKGLTKDAIYKLTPVVVSSDGSTVATAGLGTAVYATAVADGDSTTAGKVTLGVTTGNDAGYWVEAQGADVYAGGATIATITDAGTYYCEKLIGAGSSAWVSHGGTTGLVPPDTTATNFYRIRAKSDVTYKAAGDITLDGAAATGAVKLTYLADYDTEVEEWYAGNTDKFTTTAVRVYATAPEYVSENIYVGGSNKIVVSDAADALVFVTLLVGTDTSNIGFKFVKTGKELTAVNGAYYRVTAVLSDSAIKTGVIDSDVVANTDIVKGGVYDFILRGGTTGAHTATTGRVVAKAAGSIAVSGSDDLTVYFSKVGDGYVTGASDTSITITEAEAGDLVELVNTTDSSEAYKDVGTGNTLAVAASKEYTVRKVAGASEFVFVR